MVASLDSPIAEGARLGEVRRGQARWGEAMSGEGAYGSFYYSLLEAGKMYKVAFELVGEMPLLMHWDNIEGGDTLKEWRQDPKNKNQSVPGDDRSPSWTWQTYL